MIRKERGKYVVTVYLTVHNHNFAPHPDPNMVQIRTRTHATLTCCAWFSALLRWFC